MFNLQVGIDLRKENSPSGLSRNDGTSAAVRCFATQLSGPHHEYADVVHH
ncbi:hypothetical protein ACVXG7_25615 [Enterobacter hormaechei]